MGYATIDVTAKMNIRASQLRDLLASEASEPPTSEVAKV
jgi:hypothetical protein